MNADPYQALVMERSRKPLFARRPHGTDAEGEGRNRMCGDAVHVFLARAGMHVGHESEGCAILLASADLMAEAVAGPRPRRLGARDVPWAPGPWQLEQNVAKRAWPAGM